MNFIDEVVIDAVGGDGGNGCMAFRREPFKPKGGPSGGDGGRGGDIILEGDRGMVSLLDFRYHPIWKADSGKRGGGNDRFGRGAKDTVVRVPIGTIVTDARTGEAVADLTEHGQRIVVATGGKGGRGNLHFKTQKRNAPDFCEPGHPGEARRLHLELKLLAQVGVLGFPNVGKSTLVRRVSAARPKVADYPFTTLVPSLGVARLDDEREIVIADMPGLIEGASEGAGLGIQFLKHVERTRVLCHLVTPGRQGGRSPADDYITINEELAKFSASLAARPQVVALSKLDLPDVREELMESVQALLAAGARQVMPISAATGEGIPELLEALWAALAACDEASGPE